MNDQNIIIIFLVMLIIIIFILKYNLAIFINKMKQANQFDNQEICTNN